MSLLKGVLERRGLSSTAPFGDYSIPTNGMLGGSAAGQYVNERSAMEISTVYACVAVLADSIATLPIHAYQKGASSRTLVEPQPSIMTTPWSEATVQDFLTQIMVALTLRGNAFGVITQRDPKLLYPTQVVPVHNDDVQVIVRNKTSNLPGTGSIIYKVGGEVVPIDNMMHIRNISSPGSLLGMNPIQYARHTFGLAIATERYGEYFFSNSAEPSGVIEVSGDLSEEETIKLARAWSSKHQGASKAHMPAVLTGGAQYKPIGLNPDDAQFLTTRDFQRQDIISFFRIPEHVLSIVDRTTSWGTGIEQMEMGFVRNTLLPYIRRIETALSQLLPKTMYARFDLSHRLRGDTLQRYQAYTLGRNGGWLCSDEIRAAEEMDPLPDGKGQNFLQPLNMGTLGEQGAMEDNSSTKTVGA